MDGWVDGWMDGWIDVRVVGWMDDKFVDQRMNRYLWMSG